MPKRTDKNQQEIVRALRKMGASVLHCHTLGKGAPDLIVGYRNGNYLIEIKNGGLSPSRQCLTKDEAKFSSTWNGQVAIICSTDEAIKFMCAVHMMQGFGELPQATKAINRGDE